MSMSAHPALVLNADFRPVSYFPLSLLSWQDAVHAVFCERVSVVAEYDVWARSPSTQIRLPSWWRCASISERRVAFTVDLSFIYEVTPAASSARRHLCRVERRGSATLL
jgi:hypothetical protein